MTYSLRFLPEVEDDVLTGYSWYETKAMGLGEEFLRMFFACVEEIPRNPQLYQKVYGEVRRRLLRRFPYAVYFRVDENEIIVLALFHFARNPHTLENELRSRREPENS